MKLKCRPSDFQVEELTAIEPGSGEFALYRLQKRSVGLLEAVQYLARRWSIPRERFSYGGLKDRHALTTQHLTIARGPRRGLRQSNLELTYLGQVPRPFEPSDIAANRFSIVLRDLSDRHSARVSRCLAEAERDGVPNYFDRQRFGSVGRSGEYVARAWCRGDFERALWLALADASSHDHSAQRQDRKLLRDHWGNWSECLAMVRDRQLHAVISHLARHPGDFRGAFVRLDPAWRGLFLAAFQSQIWNGLLAHLLRNQCAAENLFELPVDDQPRPFYRILDQDQRRQWASESLPLPSARLHLAEGPTRQLVQQVVREFGMELREIRVKYPRDSFFSKGWRPAVFFPQQLAQATREDELFPGRWAIDLRFQLPRGSYATILVKRIMAGTG